jgi:transposase-like protein
VLGVHTPVQRCRKERNVLARLPERDQPTVRRRLRAAWALEPRQGARAAARARAELERSHPGAAASLREGLEETLTVTRLGVRGHLKRTIASTNPCESMIETVRRTSRNVKRWQNGDMCLRWTAAGMLEAEAQFRRSRLPPARHARHRRRTRHRHPPGGRHSNGGEDTGLRSFTHRTAVGGEPHRG